jgi:hypothetical protein
MLAIDQRKRAGRGIRVNLQDSVIGERSQSPNSRRGVARKRSEMIGRIPITDPKHD